MTARDALAVLRERAEACWDPPSESDLQKSQRDALALVGALEAVQTIHVPDDDGDCWADGDPYPCPTVQAIETALEGR